MTDLNPVDAMTNDYRAMCAELLAALEIQLDELRFNNRLCIRARALLAQPEPEGPTDEELLKLIPQALDDSLSGAARAMFQNSLSSASDVYKALIKQELRFARAVLARWGRPTPQPVAVSERLPGPEDCLDEGWAWFFNQRIGWRQAVLPVSPGYTHWLPAHALPTPEAP